MVKNTVKVLSTFQMVINLKVNLKMIKQMEIIFNCFQNINKKIKIPSRLFPTNTRYQFYNINHSLPGLHLSNYILYIIIIL